MGGFVHRATTGVVLAVVMALASAGAAQAAWSGSDALTTGRYNHTATALPDGHVLVTGGTNSAPLDSARLYDPTTNLWSGAAAMQFARQGQAAVLLKSGKVLVAGGFAPGDDNSSPASHYTKTAEVYDPATDTWGSAGSMSTGRYQPTMTLLQDGRVLVTGGAGDGANAAVPLDSAEVYDPDAGTWTDAAPMSTPRAQHTATLLASGDVLVAGGFDGTTGELKSAELYDPVHDTWTATGDLAQARDAATATALPDDDVLVAGGDGGAGAALDSAELYDPVAGTWHAAGSMAHARQSAATALLKDGTVLVAGGEDARLGGALKSTERYDPAANTWTDGGDMGTARTQTTLTALDDGRALIVGGNAGGKADGLAGVERFSLVTTSVATPNFGTLVPGTTSPVVNAVVTNSGAAPLKVTNVDLAGANPHDFTLVSDTCVGTPVAPGATCEVHLQFTPAAGGSRSATLTLTDNTAAGTTFATLSGAGQQPASSGGGSTAAPGGTSGNAAPAAGGQATGARPAAGGVAGTQSTSKGTAARATCTVKTTGRSGHKRSTVSCRMTWSKSGAVKLRVRLMQGTKVLASSAGTARAGRAALTLRPAKRLRAGRYAVVISGPGGAVVLRSTLRVS